MDNKQPSQGKGSRDRVSDFKKFQARWPKNMGHKGKTRCEYHSFNKNHTCETCGYKRLPTRREAVAKAVLRMVNNGELIIFRK